MQLFRQIDPGTAALVGWGVRVMLLSPNGGEGSGRVAERIAGFGGLIETEADMFSCVDAIAEDATGFGLLVIECDAFGGLEAGRRVLSMLGSAGERLPVMLISREVREQVFPQDGNAPILLRAPLSAVSLRVGFEHALRDRLVYMAA
jgi:hypothetical protein